MSDRAGAGMTGPRHGLRPGRPRLEEAELRQVAGRITALTPQRNPERRSLYVDERFIMGLDLETLFTLGLKVGQAVDGQLLWRAYELDLEKRAWDAGLRLLAAAPRTVQGLGQRLGRTYPPGTVERVLERLTRTGWLDDRNYAESYIRSRPDQGPRRLLADLIRKGVDRQLASEVVEAAFSEVEAADQARMVAEKRLARMGAVDRVAAERRLIGYLARRGFGVGVIQRALAPLLEDLPKAPPPARPAGRTPSGEGRPAQWGQGSSLTRRTGLQRRRSMRPSAHPSDD